MQINVGWAKFRLSWVLLGLFLAVILAEAYLGYSYLYASLFRQPEEVPEGKVVRVNLKAFEETVGYLEGLYSYEPPALNLPRSNPFQ